MLFAATIGRYERNEIKPSIDRATRILDGLGVSLDYLVGSSDAVLEKSLVKKITGIQELSEEDTLCLHRMLDAFLIDTKSKQAYFSYFD